MARFCEIDGMQPSVKDASGAFFIDRDPRYFRSILNYLRSDSIDLEDSVSLETLLAEADYYCLSGLTKRLEELRSAAAARVESPRVKTVSVTFYKAKSSKRWYTNFTSSDRALLRQIESVEKARRTIIGQPPWRLDGDNLIVYDKTFSIAEASEELGKCDLILRHVEKRDSEATNDILHLSSTELPRY